MNPIRAIKAYRQIFEPAPPPRIYSERVVESQPKRDPDSFAAHLDRAKRRLADWLARNGY